MADALHRDFFQQGQHGFHINAGGGQQGLAQAFAVQLLHRGGQVRVFHVEHLPHQGETIGMNTGGRQRDHYVPGFHGLVVNDLSPVHNTRGITGQVIFLFRHHPGMLRRFAADQRAAGLDAAVADALDDLLDPLGNVLSAGNIVQEEQGFGAAADDIIHTHGHTVNSDGVMLVHQQGDLQLGAHAVGAGYQHRFFHAGQIRTEQSAESSHIGEDTGGLCFPDMLFHQFDRLVAGSDINASGGVGFGFGIQHGVIPFISWLCLFFPATSIVASRPWSGLTARFG